jgi:hypothetical protein
MSNIKDLLISDKVDLGKKTPSRIISINQFHNMSHIINFDLLKNFYVYESKKNYLCLEARFHYLLVEPEIPAWAWKNIWRKQDDGGLLQKDAYIIDVPYKTWTGAKPGSALFLTLIGNTGNERLLHVKDPEIIDEIREGKIDINKFKLPPDTPIHKANILYFIPFDKFVAGVVMNKKMEIPNPLEVLKEKVNISDFTYE